MPGAFKMRYLHPLKHTDILGIAALGTFGTSLFIFDAVGGYLAKFEPFQNAMIHHFHETLFFPTSRLSGDQWNVEKVESAVRLVPDSVRQCKH